jgi:2-oxoglutarate ferredoxin oxidoreductase subunit gamma
VTERMILAGWGGQGMILLGKTLATIMMDQGMEVTCFPSYGAEVRGGTAHSEVIYSSEPIFSPVVEHADTMIIMNQPSYDHYHSRLAAQGTMLLNSTMVTKEQPHPGAAIIRIPATTLANELGDVRMGNMIMLGAYHALKRFAPVEAVRASLEKAFGRRNPALVDLNMQAFLRGAALARAQIP